MHNYGGLETLPFKGPFFIKKKSTIEQILQNNHKHGSRPKYFNKNIDTSVSGPPPNIHLYKSRVN